MQFVYSGENESQTRGRYLNNTPSEEQENKNQNDRRSRRLKLLEARRSKFDEAFICEFITLDSFLGLIIGKQGEKLNQVAKSHKVEIRVLPAHDNTRKIKIYGHSQSSITRARLDLEFVHAEYPIDEKTLNILLNNNGDTIKDISQKANLHSIWHNYKSHSLIMCGIQPAIEQAVRMIESYKNLTSV